MPSPSPSPARSPSPLRTRSPSRDRSHTRSPSRSRSPRSPSPRRSLSPRSRSRTRSRSPTSLSPRRNGRRSYTPNTRSRSRGRSYTRSPTPRDASPAPRSSKIVVEALTRNVKEDHIREIFGKYGVIKDVRMPMNPTFNINRGIAYVLYEEIDEAERAIAKMHDAQLDGSRIQVSIVLPRRRFSQTPPPARRGPPPGDRFQDDFDSGYGRGGRGPRGGGPPGAYRPPPMDGPPRYRSPPRPGLHRELRQTEATAGEIARHEEVALAAALAEPEDGEALVTAPTVVTAVGAETADDYAIFRAAMCWKKLRFTWTEPSQAAFRAYCQLGFLRSERAWIYQ
ncbi:hypothetical protein COCCADRAFT_4152 [Bipolaris zeicola 26-R-13]|uniref:RRM domain-containing protein n=1 Tax=Cochliobolus carbonum (strain 26-R-13) TaxID=930089 RepID=W6Y9B7_COCC2|nr:uncharacterized protein COCCADRAFT_4152 [Bipolaris zeicola 26-R-13]EUC34533.1 hypothetical protein COCCADRAFT_4152 [Bipolaris zeicola 26-R-13]